MTRAVPARDAVLALLLASWAAFEVLSGVAPGVDDAPGETAVSLPTTVLACATVVARRRRPVEALAASVALLLVEALLTTPTEGLSTLVAQLLLVYAVAARSSTRTAAAALVLALVPLGLVLGDPVFLGVLYAVPWLAGRVLGERQRQLADLQVASADDAARAVAEERRRNARAQHDVVSHALSLVVVQSQVARATVRSDPDAAEVALDAVKESAQVALADMRRMLGVLSEGADQGLAPQPGLADLPALLERVRAAGLDVDLREEGEPRALPAAASLTAYRVLQEGLTNALRHAGARRAQVRVAWDAREVRLRVSDDGAGPGDGPSGQGLAGLQERVALYGGTLRAGGADDGGFVLEAVLPA